MKFFLILIIIFLPSLCLATEVKQSASPGESKILSKEEIELNKKKGKTKEEEEKEKKKKEDEEKKKKEEEEKKKKEEEKKKKKKEDEPTWFIGTLLATFSQNIAPRQFLFEPTLFVSRVYGVYGRNSSLVQKRNAHLYSLLLAFETGITDVVDVALYIPGVYTHTRFGDRHHLADIALQFGFQIATDKKGSWVPNIRVLAGEIFPTGKFSDLNPGFGLLDATGHGSFATTFGLVIAKTFYNNPCHPYNWNFNFFIIHPSLANVRGLNVFGGGGPDTSGFVIPGEQFIFNLAYEFKFNKNWGWGIDIHFHYQNSSSFRNERDVADPFRGAPSSFQFSLAPEIEYDFSYELAISFALWYTLAGRNDFAFFGGAFLYSYLF